MWIYMRGRGAGHESERGGWRREELRFRRIERGGELKVFALLKIELNGKWFALCTQKSFYTLRVLFCFLALPFPLFSCSLPSLLLSTASSTSYTRMFHPHTPTHTHTHTPTPIDTKIEGLTGKRPDFGVKRNVSICE